MADDNNKVVLNTMIVKQIMRGVFPNQDDIDRVDNRYPFAPERRIAMEVLQQDKDVIIKSSDNFISYQNKSENISDKLLEYFEEEGTDISGMTDEELKEQSEVFEVPGGRYLIVEG